jgi:DNA-binding NarL/FixJ family response regulator
MQAKNVLTKRQMEILHLIADGHNTKAIAERLGLSTKTVESHRYEIENRLQVKGTALMVRMAIENGWLKA